ncbi:MAG: type III pantothenate kinase [Lachnospiraceae bacterium]|nr:type III pantothenate kinase [Lachnospiraceae bacterium]
MILAIDLGNTNVTFGCLDDKTGGTIFEERIHTDFESTSMEYAVKMKNIMDIRGVKVKDISGGILSSSVPPVTRQVKNAAEMIINKPIIEVGPGIKTGVDIKIDDPASLGPDLLVGAVAGLEQYGAPLILIDMGTATTISVINDQRRFMGGMIIPGVKVSVNGLTAHAAHLPDIAIKLPDKLINGSTVGAMQSGSVYGHASCIDGMVERIWDELGYKTAVVATGGFARTVIPCCKTDITIDSELLIKGLFILYNKNKGRV